MLEFALMHTQYTLAHGMKQKNKSNHEINAFGHDILKWNSKLNQEPNKQGKQNSKLYKQTDILIDTERFELFWKRNK